MIRDRHGNIVSGANARSAELYDIALEQFNFFRGDPVGLLDQAIAESPGFAMAHLLKAWLFALATEPEATQIARDLVDSVAKMRSGDRERSHCAALAALCAGEWTRAAGMLDRHCMDWPHDMAAIQCGHLCDFYRANARDLRDRLARVLPKWGPDMPGRSALLGMYAFGLEEAGDYSRAEETGRTAIDLDARDSWAHHAVAHVMEMQGRAEDGLGWMAAREAWWDGEGSFFKVHNWWHKGLYHLELQQNAEALALYDGPVRGERPGLALALVDASALLWRLHCAGVDTGDRWQELALAWDAHADGRLYPFNDLHAAMAWLGAGQEEKAQAVLRKYRETVENGVETVRWAREIGAPLIEGFIAFSRGDHERAAALLYGARHVANGFGGSHAQRDVIDWTLCEAAARGGLGAMAEALASERLALKPHSPLNRAFLTRGREAGVRLSGAA